MKVLSFSSCFPSPQDPQRGIFVLHRLGALSALTDVEVVHPVPHFPLYKGHFPKAANATDHMEGLTVHHPRYFFLPGVLKRLDAAFYSRGMRPWLARHIAAHGRPSLLDAHFVWPDGVAVSRLAAAMNLPYTITLRGTLNSRVRNPAMRSQIARALLGAAAIISVSHPMAKIAASMGVPGERIAVVPNGVDTECFAPMAASEARRTLGLRGDRKYVVTVAHMRPGKGLEETIDAIAPLPADVHLLVVGQDDNGGTYRKSLQQRAAAVGCAERLTFVGAQPQHRVPLYINAADVCVLASHAEGCPNVVLESLSCGRPMVATDVGEVPYLIAPGVSGQIVSVGNAAALSESLWRVLNRPWSAQEIRSTQPVRSWATVAQEVLAVFRRALGEQP